MASKKISVFFCYQGIKESKMSLKRHSAGSIQEKSKEKKKKGILLWLAELEDGMLFPCFAFFCSSVLVDEVHKNILLLILNH